MQDWRIRLTKYAQISFIATFIEIYFIEFYKIYNQFVQFWVTFLYNKYSAYTRFYMQ